MKEIWKCIDGFPLYDVSNLGRIRSRYFNKVKILKQDTDKDGYKQLNLFKNGTSCKVKVHRIVAYTFLIKDENKKLINHKNGIKDDNRVSNLEWVTESENVLHSMYSLGNCIKPIICVETGKKYTSMKKASEELNLPMGNLSMALSKKYKRKTCGGYHWRFCEKNY